MNKQEQRKEMADIIKSVTLFGDDNYRRIISHISCMELAEELLKHYQPKLPEGSVVLTQEEWANLHEDYAKALYEKDKQARKQAVKEVLGKLHNSLDKSIPAINGVSVMLIKNMLDEIAKQYGVKIKNEASDI